MLFRMIRILQYLSGVEKINSSMVEINSYRPQLQSKVTDLTSQLNSVKSRINSELNCPTSGSVATQCDDVKSDVASITIQPNFNQVSNTQIKLALSVDKKRSLIRILLVFRKDIRMVCRR